MKRLFEPKTKWMTRSVALFGMLFFCLFGLLATSHGVFAASSTPLGVIADTSGLSTQTLPILIASIIRIVLGVLGIITVLLVIYAGFMYMGAKGDMAKVDKAKKILTQTVIGLFIILASYSIASYILGRLLEVVNGPGTIGSIEKKYSEPLAGSLGAGIVESHYPMRDAVNVPRNTKIFVTFKEAVKPDTIIDGWTAGCTYVVVTPTQTPALCSTNLKASAVEIYETAKDPLTSKLSRIVTGEDHHDDVSVTVSPDHKTFVFRPKNPLGNANTDTNYTVALKSTIQKADGTSAFVGINSAGYGWNFTVSTVIDLTPPKVVSIIPYKGNQYARNITIEITFNEAMDPIASTGKYTLNGGTSAAFQNITVGDDATSPINGSYDISNAYQTIDFTTDLQCGADPCNGIIYCLPGGKTITVDAKAASIDHANPPQGLPQDGVFYDGLVDAAGNSLDGSGDGKACGSSTDSEECTGTTPPPNDDYTWSFSTTEEINTTVPKIVSLSPDIQEGNIDVSRDISLTFNVLLKGSTVISKNASIWPDPKYPMWFVPQKVDMPIPATPPATPAVQTYSVINISHPAFISATECGIVNGAGGNCSYWPVVTHEIKSAYQICMFPSGGPTANSTYTQPDAAHPLCAGSDRTNKYCCNGVASAQPCQTDGNSSAVPLILPQVLPAF